MIAIVFFGSFQHYSALILESLIQHPNIEVVGVVTTPPMPVGRKQIITKTPVHDLAEKHHIPVFTPHTLSTFQSNDARSRTPADAAGSEDVDLMNVINQPPDYFITAGYGKILPKSWLEYPSHDSLNLHFSLLPAYRGANPAEWAIMCGETKTGISLITMSKRLDGGDIIAQNEIDIDPTDTRETLYEKLYELGAKLLPQWLGDAETLAFQHGGGPRLRDPSTAKASFESPLKQPANSPSPYAALLKRQDGFLPWMTIQKFINKQPLTATDFPSKHFKAALDHISSCRQEFLATQRSEADKSSANRIRVEPKIDAERTKFLERLPRALAGYPSLWTIVPTPKGDKRLKIISFSPFIVQLEGGKPTTYNQIKNQIM